MIKKKILDYLYDKGIYSSSFFPGINTNPQKKQKKILLIYLNYKKAVNYLNATPAHTNQIRYIQMVNVLIKKDFCIDTCLCNDNYALKEIVCNSYDYILGFGTVFDAVARQSNAYKIVYMTEAPYWFSEPKEKERLEYYRVRHGKYPKKQNIRTGEYYSCNQERKADYILFQGEREHYINLGKPLWQIYPNVFINEKYPVDQIAQKKKTSSFIVYGTSNNWIRKGIDLLFEIFSLHPELTLFICDNDVKKQAYDMGYNDFPVNIIDCGFVNYNSVYFCELFLEASYILLPSSFEGMPSAVMTGMAHATIPVVTHKIGLDDLTDYCEYFDSFNIKEMEKKIVELTQQNQEAVILKCMSNYNYARSNFKLGNFADSFSKAIDDIIKKSGRER